VIPLLVYGASGHARVVHDAIVERSEYDVVAFIDEHSSEHCCAWAPEIPVMRAEAAMELARARGIADAIVAFGNCEGRQQLGERLLADGLRLATVIHPGATVSRSATIGDGVFVAAGAIVNPGTTIGRGAIVNTRASIDHDCIVGPAAHICPGVVMAGTVTIGAMSWIGVGSVLSNGVAVGCGSIIGAGAVVVSAIGDDVVAYGSPARVVRPVRDDDRLIRLPR
jgi:sugar O-acyltransferase (sialic acid O-acetyltransferase NeuD family)